MHEGTPLRSGALDFAFVANDAAGLRTLIYGAGFTPVIASQLGGRRFPVFRTASFSLMDDFGFLINVWVVRDEIENFHVIGGVTAEVDKSEGYQRAYQRALDVVLNSDEASRRALAIIDHVISEYIEVGE